MASKNLVVCFISTKDKKADIFTKPLVSTRFTTLHDNLSIMVILLQLSWHIKTLEDIQLITENRRITNTTTVNHAIPLLAHGTNSTRQVHI
jgi:hypothetical protein